MVIENKDCVQLIRQYDRRSAFFTAIRPTMNRGLLQKRGRGRLPQKGPYRLRDALIRIEGKFLLSYNDCEFIRELYDAPGIQIEAFTRINNIKQRYDNGAQFPEILIANYDMWERSHAAPTQMNLFELPGSENF